MDIINGPINLLEKHIFNWHARYIFTILSAKFVRERISIPQAKIHEKLVSLLFPNKFTVCIEQIQNELLVTWFDCRSRVPRRESSPISDGNVESALLLKFEFTRTDKSNCIFNMLLQEKLKGPSKCWYPMWTSAREQQPAIETGIAEISAEHVKHTQHLEKMNRLACKIVQKGCLIYLFPN